LSFRSVSPSPKQTHTFRCGYKSEGLADLKIVLGEFFPYCAKSCNFDRIVRQCTIKGEGNLCNGNFSRAKQWYDYLIQYIEVVKLSAEIRQRELGEISFGQLVNPDVEQEIRKIINGYF
jgi:hypothetical protein